MKISLQQQEQIGTYKFSSQIYYTKGIEAEFEYMTVKMIAETLRLIKELVNMNTADYFQVAIAEMEDGKKIKVYIIDDITHITFLLPSEYRLWEAIIPRQQSDCQTFKQACNWQKFSSQTHYGSDRRRILT